jgi:adenylate kinase
MIILMGVAGSGKSKQGKILADEHGYAWISTGEILRVLVTGKRRHEMLQGKLLSDSEMIHLMDKVLELIDTKQEFVLDGFPRTVPQTDWLLEQVHKGRFKLTAIIHLDASEDVVRSRLLDRARPDDTDQAITERFDEYRAITLPIIAHLEQMGAKVCKIDAARDERTVHDAILECVD